MKRKREDEDGVPNNSIYWAKIKGYPWWPAMVTNDGLREYWRVKNSNVEYFCQFFGHKYEFAWISRFQLIQFEETDLRARDGSQLFNLDKASEALKTAIRDANLYYHESVDSRLDYFYQKYENHISKTSIKSTGVKQHNHGNFDKDKFLKKYNIQPCWIRLDRCFKPTTITNPPVKTKKAPLIETIGASQSFSNLEDIMPPQALLPKPDDETLDENFSFNKLYKIYSQDFNLSCNLNTSIDEDTTLKSDMLRTLSDRL